ncbi:TerC family protein [Bacillus subtilis]|uniref:TerC family protein n=1 Tax=Bacillus subtilis TaxID=1423 RepID=UPI0021D9C4C9|nr:hypothetical protein [Bacillus subtilis]
MLHSLYIIFVLVVMEGLLSADNALVLSMMASKVKDPDKRKKVLYYGMIGAVVFRAVFILLGTILLKLWIIKVIGALYLLHMAIGHFKGSDNEDVDGNGVIDKYENTLFHKIIGKMGVTLSQFWAVVVSVEFMDLAFSIDSITAALALSNSFWVLLLGGVLGIVMMRSVAQLFTGLIAKVPEMEHTAFILIAIIGLKMMLSTVHNIVNFCTMIFHSSFTMTEIEVPDLLFFAILVVTFGMTFVVHAFRKNKTAAA